MFIDVSDVYACSDFPLIDFPSFSVFVTGVSGYLICKGHSVLCYSGACVLFYVFFHSVIFSECMKATKLLVNFCLFCLFFYCQCL